MKKYSLDNPKEAEKISSILSDYGIYIQRDLFNSVYFLVERPSKAKTANRKRSPNLKQGEIKQIVRHRESGKTIREISSLTGYSIGAIHSALHKQK